MRHCSPNSRLITIMSQRCIGKAVQSSVMYESSELSTLAPSYGSCDELMTTRSIRGMAPISQKRLHYQKIRVPNCQKHNRTRSENDA